MDSLKLFTKHVTKWVGFIFHLLFEFIYLAKNLPNMEEAEIKRTLKSLLPQISKFTAILLVFAALPLVAVIFCLLFQLPLGGLYGGYTIWVVLLITVELVLLTPVYLFLRRLREHHPKLIEDLTDWMDIVKSFLFNGISLAIFVSLIPVWRSPGSLPLLILVLLCWATLPMCAVSGFCKRIYPTVRAIQLLLLAGLLVLNMTFPQHMKQITWSSGRKIGGALTGSVNQREVTAEWKTLLWFNNQGEPLVWYSGSSKEGYRLWAAPGFDAISGDELKSINTQKERDTIVDSLNSAELLQQRQIASENEARMLREKQKKMEIEKKEADQKEKEAEKARLESIENERIVELKRLEADRIALQKVEVEKREYISQNIQQTENLKAAGIIALAVAVKDVEHSLDTPLSIQIASLFPSKKVKAVGNMFTPSFTQDGAFNRVMKADLVEINRLQLDALVDSVFLGFYHVQYTTNSELEGIITAKLTFDGTVQSSSTGAILEKVSFVVSGAAFEKTMSLSAAKDRLSKSLAAHQWQFLTN